MLVLGLTLNATVRLTQSSAYKASTYHHRVSTELLADACLLAALKELEPLTAASQKPALAASHSCRYSLRLLK